MEKREKFGLIAVVFSLLAIIGFGWCGSEALAQFEKKISLAKSIVAGKEYLGPDIDYTGPPKVIRYSTFTSGTSLTQKSWHIPMFKILSEKSKGKLVVKPFFAGTLHGAKDGFKACIENITDFTQGYTLWNPKAFKLFNGLAMPFLFPDGPVATQVANEVYAKYLKKEYEKMGVYLAYISMIRAYNLLSKTPIRTIEDVKGMKIRSGGGIMARIVKALGAVPVVIPASAFYTAFQRGVFDAILTHDAGMIQFRTYEIGKYRTVLDLFNVNTEFCLNKKTFNNLPKDLKRMFYNWLQQDVQVGSQLYYEAEGEKAIETMNKAGIETIKLSPGELKRWKDVMRKVEEEWIAEKEAEGLPARAFVADMKELSQKWSKKSWNDITRETIQNPIQGIIDF